MVITSINHQCRASAAQVVARRQVRMYLRKIREKEYSKLRALVPSVATKKKVTKVQVIEEAVRYIEKLHEALLERFRETHGSMAEDKAQETVRIFVNRMMSQQTPNTHHSNHTAPLVQHNSSSFEKQRTQPSFLFRKQKNH